MGYVRASKFRDIDRQRKIKLDEYHKNRELYDSQDQRYQDAILSHKDEIKSTIMGICESSLGDMKDNVEFSIQEDSVEMSYHGFEHSHGVSWKVRMGFSYRNDEFEFQPTIRTHDFTFNDLDLLKSTYDFFSKLSQVNWKMILTDYKQTYPQKADYFNIPHPGHEGTVTYKFDTQKSNALLDHYAGKDVWLMTFISRESTYDPNRSNAKYRGVHGPGFIKVENASRVNVSFYFLPAKNYNSYSQRDIDKAQTTLVKLGREMISVKSPTVMMTTEELLED